MGRDVGGGGRWGWTQVAPARCPVGGGDKGCRRGGEDDGRDDALAEGGAPSQRCLFLTCVTDYGEPSARSLRGPCGVAAATVAAAGLWGVAPDLLRWL